MGTCERASRGGAALPGGGRARAPARGGRLQQAGSRRPRAAAPDGLLHPGSGGHVLFCARGVVSPVDPPGVDGRVGAAADGSVLQLASGRGREEALLLLGSQPGPAARGEPCTPRGSGCATRPHTSWSCAAWPSSCSSVHSSAAQTSSSLLACSARCLTAPAVMQMVPSTMHKALSARDGVTNTVTPQSCGSEQQGRGGWSGRRGVHLLWAGAGRRQRRGAAGALPAPVSTHPPAGACPRRCAPPPAPPPPLPRAPLSPPSPAQRRRAPDRPPPPLAPQTSPCTRPAAWARAGGRWPPTAGAGTRAAHG